jgi:PTS system fructose-specific IIA component
MLTSESLIELNIKSKDKGEFIRTLAEKARKLGHVSNVAGYLEDVFARENLFPTVIGYGVALPYGKSSHVSSPFIAFARSDEEFRWDSRIDLGARLIFLTGVPEGQDDDLDFKLVTYMSGGLINRSYRERLLQATDARGVVEVFEKMGL